MMNPESARAVTFDFGQTLADLDVDLLSRRLAERALDVPADRLQGGVAVAWQVYNESIKRGLGGHPWKFLMRRLLAEAAVLESEVDAAVDWLWSEQPVKNLWRRPVPGMIDVVRDLRRAGVAVAVISNSEGRLAELIAELEWTKCFDAIADSGKLKLEKPGRAIFDWTMEQVGATAERAVHIGDSYAADVEGALGAGLSAIWFRGEEGILKDSRVRVCQDAASVRAALRAWGIDLPA